MNKILSVIIVSFQNIKILEDCIQSILLYNDLGKNLEIIVSDNSLDTHLYNYISNKYTNIKICKNDNKGFGAGNNRGVEISSGKYLLFLNPDTIIVEPIFKFAVEKFENNKDLALFGMQLIDKTGKESGSFCTYDKYDIFTCIWDRHYRKIGKFIDGKMFICGADMFVRRSSFTEAGGFDENIFMYKEEADLIKRIKIYSDAKKIAYFKEKKIIHLEGGTEKKGENNIEQRLKVAKRLTDSDKYYAEKWGLNFNKIIKSRIKCCRIKKFIFRCFFNSEKVFREKKLISFYKSLIHKY